ncbi:MAG TPA: FAD-dependent oxidoreductase [Gemmatimonadaceae bacterium]|nr:FAD-dependent oxidoreductase [Gemmatimonadaceae bacterium]
MPDVTGASVVIAGAGIVGASIAYHLAARGCRDVLLLERAESPASGSTGRSAGGVRHQFGSAVNVRLSLYSIERLKAFTEEIGGHASLRQVGYLFLHTDPATWAHYRAQAQLQRSLGVPVELLGADDAERLVPGVKADDVLGASYCAWDGYCDPYGIAMGYLARARALGARVRCEAPVTAVHAAGGRVTAVETPQGMLGCDVLVNACGAWAGRLGALAGLDIPVQPYRRTIYMSDAFDGLPDGMPFSFDVSSGFYIRKEGRALLFGLTNPHEPPGERLDVDWEWLETVLDAGMRRFPMLEEAQLAHKRCWSGLYEVTPDHMPILGRHPALANFVDASGFSGHGVMHSPATGLLMAEEILDGRAHTIDIDELRIARFDSRELRHETHVF